VVIWAILRSLRVLAVRPEGGGGHDINIAAVRSQGGLSLWSRLFEPGGSLVFTSILRGLGKLKTTILI